MAFWGVEVKPGKPHIHPPNGAKGRLHISQATMGTGNGTGKVVLQCNIRNKSPVFLCSLFPERSESCQLNMEFNEVEQVVFSVVGPRSVHITGYYLRSTHIDDESESFGEDIAATESDRSLEDDDYDYSDDFINDGEIYVAPNTSSDEERPRNGKRKFRRLRKYQSSDEDSPLANKVNGSIEEILSSDSDAFVDDFFISQKKRKSPKAVENGGKPQEMFADLEKKAKDTGNAEKTLLAEADNRSSPANESASPGHISKKKMKKEQQPEEMQASDNKNTKKGGIRERSLGQMWNRLRIRAGRRQVLCSQRLW